MPETRNAVRLWLEASDPTVARLARALAQGKRCVATGAVGSSTSYLASSLARALERTVLLVVAHIDEGEDALAEGDSLGVPTLRLPALEVLPGESGVSAELIAERILAQRAAMHPAPGPRLVVAPVQALMQAVPAPDRLPELARSVRTGDRVRPGDLASWLAGAGYRRVDALEEPGEYSVRGGIIDVFTPGAAPVRLDFLGDEVERINEIDLDTMGSDRRVEGVELVCAELERVLAASGVSFIDVLPAPFTGVIAETMEIVEQARGYYERAIDARGLFGPPAVLAKIENASSGLVEANHFSAGATSAELRLDLPVSPLPAFARELDSAMEELRALEREGDVLVACINAAEKERITELLAARAGRKAQPIGARPEVLRLHHGFVWRGEPRPLALVASHELLHRSDPGRGRIARGIRGSRAVDTFFDLSVGDYVVHAEHGIARFTGLQVMKSRPLPGRPAPTGAEGEEHLVLEFAGKSRLYVPASTIDQVQKYVGGFAGKPPLSTLGGQKWRTQKQRVAEGVRDLASELLRVRAAREAMPGIRYPTDTPWQREFEEEFPFEETEDQLAAMAEIKKDMMRERPMDRLVCGDVGFGKTELAIRAAFKACESGRQVAVLVPTTVLAEQHERTFRERFAAYPFRVESLSRFKTQREVNDTLAAVRRGQVDVVIGTHRLLSGDVRFAELGLVVVDEEQRFGVEHKERLLQLRLTVDVLTLSATPIPRTLHMAMLGIRDISSLTTPPVDRRAIVTEVIPYNERRIAQAIARELARDGQVFFVHNRVHNITTVADRVQALAPGARVVVGHGQMPPAELEEVMLTFTRRQADILVATTIIESGIDIPSANTMIINDADRFGLADLHQLRGRVGRSRHRAYCYLLLPPDRPVREVAQKRLKALERYAMLGAGFKIAMRDLEIRGAGNILGAEQSGHIAVVGYDMYCRLLERAVRELQHDDAPDPPSSTSVEIGVGGVLPRAYIPSDQRRLGAYRRIASAATHGELDRLRVDLEGAYGPIPPAAQRLLDLASLRVAAAALGVKTITVREKDVIFRCPDPARALCAMRDARGTVTALPPKTNDTMHEVFYRPPEGYLEPETLLRVLRARLGAIGAPSDPATDEPTETLAARPGNGPAQDRPAPRAQPRRTR